MEMRVSVIRLLALGLGLAGVLLVGGCAWTEPEPTESDETRVGHSTEPSRPLPFGGKRPAVKGWGDAQLKTLAVDPFDKVTVSGPVEVTLTQDRLEGLRAQAQTNILEHLLFEVRGTTLHLGLKEPPNGGELRATVPVRFLVNFKKLQELNVIGDAQAELLELKTDRVRIEARDRGRVMLDRIESEALYVFLFDDAEMETLSGWSQRQQIDINGLGHYKAPNLESQTALVRIVGDASVVVRVKSVLEATIVGRGRVRYHGKPRVRKKITGEGFVKPAGPN